jgi:hypothetical protein
MAESRKPYRVLSPLKVGGTRYSPADPKPSTVELTDAEASELRPLGVIGDMLTPEQVAERRAAALAAFIPTLTMAELGKKNALTPEAKARLAAELGLEPSDEELRQAFDAWAKARAAAEKE